MYVIIGPHGAGAEIVDAVLDSKDYDIHPYDLFLVTFNDRGNLMLIEDLSNDVNFTYLDKLDEMSTIYKSVQVYLPIYKFEKDKTNRKHKYIYVDWGSSESFNWVKNRCDMMDLELEYSERDVKNMGFVNKYRADLVIKLEDILSGKLIDILKKFAPDCELDEFIYSAWLELIDINFPFNTNKD